MTIKTTLTLGDEDINLLVGALNLAEASATYQAEADAYRALAEEIRRSQAAEPGDEIPPQAAAFNALGEAMSDSCPHYVGCPHDVDDNEPAEPAPTAETRQVRCARCNQEIIRNPSSQRWIHRDPNDARYDGVHKATPSMLPDGTPVVWAPQLGRYITIPLDDDDGQLEAHDSHTFAVAGEERPDITTTTEWLQACGLGREERPDRLEAAKRSEALEQAAERDAGWHTP